MSTSSDHTFIHYSPYIRLTKKADSYTLWLVTYIPDNFTIPNEPTVEAVDANTQVSVYVESNGATPSSTWIAVPFKIPILAPSQAGSSVNATVFLDDPEPEGSSEMGYEEAEQE